MNVRLGFDLLIAPHEVNDISVHGIISRVQNLEIIKVQSLDMLGKFNLD